jgi:hypothetical protein
MIIIRVALIAAVAMLAACQFTPTWIVADDIEFDSLSTGTNPSLALSFGSSFTVLPQVSAVLTGFSNPASDSEYYIGWSISIDGISQTGATITITPNATFIFLKNKWVAAQGDTLQVFLLSGTIPIR